jgi:hypothetical protein
VNRPGFSGDSVLPDAAAAGVVVTVVVVFVLDRWHVADLAWKRIAVYWLPASLATDPPF